MNRAKWFFIGVLFLMLAMPFAAAAEETRYNIPIGESPSWGPENAPVTIIEFLDYQ
ncbi:MAG: hypothetical protein JSU90_06835 [Nitrospiraceae bacterium]|nr:MAG: hypothetical protein JSU90_06835 [Nitrospiraceae bacterium]